jgi:hypothetical protein
MSEAFWTVAVAVVFGCSGIWTAFRTAYPRRRLTCTVSHTPLVRGPVDNSLEIRRNGTPLADPYLVTVVLTNPGRRDIASTDFDRDQPFRVCLAVPYAALLDTESRPSDDQAPPGRIEGTELHIGPGRLGSGTTATYHVVVDTVPAPDCRHSLLDVRVQCTTAPAPRGISRTVPLVRP